MARMVVTDPKQGKAILDKLELAKFQKPYGSSTNHIAEQYKLTERDLNFIIEDVHGRLRYHLAHWLQENGFDIT